MAVTGVPTEGNIQPVVPASCGDGGLVAANIRFDGTSVVPPDATPDTPNQAAGVMMEGWCRATNKARVLDVDDSGRLIVNAFIFPATGATLTSFPFVFVAPAAIVPLPVPIVGATEYTVTVIGATPGDVFLVRSSTSPAGTGLPIIAPGGSVTLDAFGSIPPAVDCQGLGTNVGVGHLYVTQASP